MQQYDILTGVALILMLGIGAQWIAWRLRIPSILLLLSFGILAGPVSALVLPGGEALLAPTELLGDDRLLPLVSLAVGLILYEGGLTLRFRDIGSNDRVVWMLITLGAMVTWIAAAFFAALFLNIPPSIAILLGAILTVTGPTVIGPLLSHIRPVGPSATVLRWEGIAIDPVGALLAVIVFEVIMAGQGGESIGATLWMMVQSVGLTVIVGGGLGFLAAGVLVLGIKHYLVPEGLQNPVSLLFVVVIFAISDAVQKESGLLATTVMGMVLANQRQADVRHILEFKENLKVLLISALFIILGARLDLDGFVDVGFGIIPFVAVLILIVRPLSVYIATLGSELDLKQRVLIASVAPRGIVAAAVASVFGLALEAQSVQGAELLSPIIFSVIIITVAFYGLAAGPITRWLGIADTNPQGVLFIGAFPWVRDIAQALHRRGFKVRLVDANYQHIQAARMAGLNVWYGNALADRAAEEIDLTGIGYALAATPNDEVNALVGQRLGRELGKANVFQLKPHEPDTKRKGMSSELHARVIGADSLTFGEMDGYASRGGIVKVTPLSDEFTFDQFRLLYGQSAKVLFVISERNKLTVVTRQTPKPVAGQTIVAMVNPDELFM